LAGAGVALAVKLSEHGHFTWAAALADELKAADDRGEPDDGTRHYEYWLAALERLVVERERKEAQAGHLLNGEHAWPAHGARPTGSC
jgi:nitrile hydratase accessory protein